MADNERLDLPTQNKCILKGALAKPTSSAARGRQEACVIYFCTCVMVPSVCLTQMSRQDLVYKATIIPRIAKKPKCCNKKKIVMQKSTLKKKSFLLSLTSFDSLMRMVLRYIDTDQYR